MVLLLFKAADNKYKLVVVNHNVLGGTTGVEAFSDSSDAYPMRDFQWGWTSAYWSRFTFPYRWDAARQKFSKEIAVNKDTAVSTFLNPALTQCVDAFNNHGGDLTAPVVECFWSWDELTTENIARQFINLHAKLRRWCRFKTSLAGAKFELGDPFNTDHSKQPWASSDFAFQVRHVGIDPADGSVLIEGTEINEL